MTPINLNAWILWTASKKHAFVSTDQCRRLGNITNGWATGRNYNIREGTCLPYRRQMMPTRLAVKNKRRLPLRFPAFDLDDGL